MAIFVRARFRRFGFVCGPGLVISFICLLFAGGFGAERTTAIYRIVGQDTLRLDVYTPNAGAPHPVLIMIHEGGFRSGSRSCFAPHGEYFAGKGIGVISIDYRLVQHGGRFPNALFDCLHAIRWTKNNAARHRIDTARVFLFGSSAGAYLAVLCGLANSLPPDLRDGIPMEDLSVSGVVSNMGLYDWEKCWWKGDGFVKPSQEKRASPVRYIDKRMPDFLLFAGEQDHLFGYEQAGTFADLVNKRGGRAQLRVKPGQDHEGVCNASGALWQWELPEMLRFIGQYRKETRNK